jgi:hypothetical protein
MSSKHYSRPDHRSNHESLSTFSRARTRQVKMGMECSLLFIIVLLLLCSCGPITAASGNPLSLPGSLVNTAATTATATSKRATQTPHTLVSAQLAVLGGTEEAFTKKYGNAAAAHGGDINEYQDTKENLDIGIDYRTFDAAGHSLAYHFVFFVDVSPLAPKQPWSAIVGQTFCNSFLPPDAYYVNTVPSTNPSLRFIKMYYSASLANTIPAYFFTDFNRQQVKPGTIYLEYSGLNDSSRLQSCLIGTGQPDN